MVVVLVIGGAAVLLGLADLTDFLLARAGKRSLLHSRPDPLAEILISAAQNDPGRHPHDFTG
jgi:hypothetical protein